MASVVKGALFDFQRQTFVIIVIAIIMMINDLVG
jgi:hypothetical protein